MSEDKPITEQQKARTYVSALKEERKGYELKDKPERVAAVDAEIARVAKAGRVTPLETRPGKQATESR
jgi:hypothetical protein